LISIYGHAQTCIARFKKNIFASALVGALSGAYAGAKIGEAKQKGKENAAKRIFKKK